MEKEVTASGAPCTPFLVQPRSKPSLWFPLSTGIRHLIHEARDPFFSFLSHLHLAGRPFPPQSMMPPTRIRGDLRRIPLLLGNSVNSADAPLRLPGGWWHALWPTQGRSLLPPPIRPAPPCS